MKQRVLLKEGIDMTFVQLKYILTIAETKSLNKAAEQLYVSQPSLTNALKELEKEVGITIFFRTGRGVTLTNDGVEFLTYAREIYREYEQLMQRYGDGGSYKKKFAVSTQHYSKNWICPNMNWRSVRLRRLKLFRK